MTKPISFSGRLGIQQRVLPEYRRGFFDALAEACEGGLSVFAGGVDSGESIPTTDQLNSAKFLKARNRHIGKVQSPYYFLWQGGLLDWLSDWNPDLQLSEKHILLRILSLPGEISREGD
jgi:hypothetical protein